MLDAPEERLDTCVGQCLDPRCFLRAESLSPVHRDALRTVRINRLELLAEDGECLPNRFGIPQLADLPATVSRPPGACAST